MASAKVALVTGGGSGIGKAIALKLAQNGAKVAIASRSLARVEQVAEELQKLSVSALPLAMDVRNRADVQRAVDAIVFVGDVAREDHHIRFCAMDVGRELHVDVAVLLEVRVNVR